MALLWVVESGPAVIHLFGGGPPSRQPWQDADIEGLLPGCDEFWNEVPEIGEEARALAVQYGVDPMSPLPSRLTAEEMARVEKAADEVGVSLDMLRLIRPWLAAQLLKNAFQAKAGLIPENAAGIVLRRVAQEAGVPVYSETGSPEETMAFFGSMAPEAEEALLSQSLDDIEAGAEAFVRDAEAVAQGDAAVGERVADQLRVRYPALYEPLLVQRNRAWVGRVERMVDEGRRAFIIVGSAHLAGEHSVQGMLAEAGIPIRPV